MEIYSHNYMFLWCNHHIIIKNCSQIAMKMKKFDFYQNAQAGYIANIVNVD